MKFLSKINPSMIKIALVVAVILVMAAPFLASAQMDELDKAAGVAGFADNETDMAVIVGKIIAVVIRFLGLIAVIIVLIGGFQWMTSGGDSEKISNARKLMINGLIGLVIIVLAYAITVFVIGKLGYITGKTTP
jgi:uncharacterized membrane protein